MIKELWINLSVKDVKKSKEFFSKIGFTINAQYGESEHSTSMLIGSKNIVVMLFSESIFKGFTKNDITDTNKSNEVLFSFDAASREEVDEMAKKVRAAGGVIFGEPGENQGWMYGFAFLDPDGHRWNMLHMDMSKMPNTEK